MSLRDRRPVLLAAPALLLLTVAACGSTDEGGAASADTITLQAAASIQGVVPFFSDVRVFNTSYTETRTVTATYRCFLAASGTSCPASAPTTTFTLAPRQSRSFNDMVATTFAAPNTAGVVP